MNNQAFLPLSSLCSHLIVENYWY